MGQSLIMAFLNNDSIDELSDSSVPFLNLTCSKKKRTLLILLYQLKLTQGHAKLFTSQTNPAGT